jgi:hypothetical protein
MCNSCCKPESGSRPFRCDLDDAVAFPVRPELQAVVELGIAGMNTSNMFHEYRRVISP